MLNNIAKKRAPRAAILMYHRVAEGVSDPWGLCVSPAHLAQQLAVLRQDYQPLSLPHLCQAHRAGKIPPRAVVVTFDDGYADNFLNARPVLERYQVPATIFVATGCMGQPREFWWDELERLLLQPGELPASLSLTIDGRSHHWDLGAAVSYSQADGQRGQRAWEGEPGSRLWLYHAIWALVRPRPPQEQAKILEALRTWVGAQTAVRPPNRPLTLDELRQLDQNEWIELGAHTVSHPLLSAHSLAFQRQEIQGSKAWLEQLLHRPVTTFSYPFGNFEPQTETLVQELGFDCACSTVPETVWRRSGRFALPRFAVEDWPGHHFARQLRQWFEV